MIGQLHGKLIDIMPPVIILDVGGIGYEVNLPLSHIARIGSVGSLITLYTHLAIREDAHLLFGFLDKSERDCFRQLIKVSGVGVKIGLALLSTMNSSQIQFAIDKADIAALSQTPGVGKKMAERMILELKGKLALSTTQVIDGIFASEVPVASLITQDIANALESLGYATKEINQVLKQLTNVNDLSSGIKQALQLLSKF